MKNYNRLESAGIKILIVIVFVLLYSCVKIEREAKVETGSISNIAITSAIATGNLIDQGEGIIDHGHCWSTTANPTTNDSKTSLRTAPGVGIFTSELQGLQTGTKYFLKAYAMDGSGTVCYGRETSFTTISLEKPEVTTALVTSITSTTAISGGNVTSDGGSPVTDRGVCWSTSANPTISLNTKTSNSSGTGPFTSNITDLTANTTYFLRAFATNNAGTSYGNQVSFKTSPPNVIDVDGNVYATVAIGTQVWMKDNLKTTRYNDGTTIQNITGGTSWSNLTSDAYCWYGNNASNKNIYGAMYNWYAVNTGKLCPTGWHVPSDAEWKVLEMNMGMSQAQADGEGWRGTDEGGKLKEAGTNHWIYPNVLATNESWFTALPGGYRDPYGTFGDVGYRGFWWSSDEGSIEDAWRRILSYDSGAVDRGSRTKTCGFSVRCIKN